MNGNDIKKGSLVIVIDRESTPPRFCWGLVLTRFPSGDNYDVQTGESPKQKNIFSGDKLILVIQTEKNFANPLEAVEHYKNDILLEITLIAFTSRELAELKRLKTRIERKRRSWLARGVSRLLRRV